MDLLQIDLRFLAYGYEEEIILLVLQEQVFGVSAGNFTAQRLRIGHREQRRVENRGDLDAELVEIGEKLCGRTGHGWSGNGCRRTTFRGKAGLKTSPSADKRRKSQERTERFEPRPKRTRAAKEFPVAFALLFGHIGAACGGDAARAGVAQG